MKMKVNLQVIKPLGGILILIFSALGIIMLFTADLGVPEKYESLHETEYYAQNADTMAELLDELYKNVFTELPGEPHGELNEAGDKIIITAGEEDFEKVKAVILRDFDESLFVFEQPIIAMSAYNLISVPGTKV